MNTPIRQLSPDEALVLLEFFGRFGQDGAFRLRNSAEFVAFSKVSAQLEKALVAPFQDSYAQQLDAARLRLSDEYPRLEPGVEPVRHA